MVRASNAFSAASGGQDKYRGALRIERMLTEIGCVLLAPMGMAEVEMEEVEMRVLPWADTVAAACSHVADAVAACARTEPPAKDASESVCHSTVESPAATLTSSGLVGDVQAHTKARRTAAAAFLLAGCLAAVLSGVCVGLVRG